MNTIVAPGGGAFAASSAFDPPRVALVEHRHGLAFSGSGSEYFRIWIVNLLLTLVTFGLYYPFAKARRLRYFYGNTSVAGHAFDFHADPWRMLRGYLLAAALFGLYTVASNVSPLAGLFGFVVLAALWPALLRGALRFRLANTSWRSLRFRFVGDMAGAYGALLPLFLPFALVLVGAAVTGEPEDGRRLSVRGAGEVLGALGLVTAALLLPWMWWRLKRYQHDHYQLAAVRTRLDVGPGAFYAVAGKAAALAVSSGVALVLVGFVVAGVLPRGLVAVLAVLAVYGVLLVAVQPYLTSRMQNLVWSGTRSRSLGFDSDLRFRPLLALTLKNWLLIVCTLGLYWPFAAVATARLRIESVTLLARVDLDTLVARAHEREADAAGDAAGDVFGIDVGL